jgi:hypothetical protein
LKFIGRGEAENLFDAALLACGPARKIWRAKNKERPKTSSAQKNIFQFHFNRHDAIKGLGFRSSEPAKRKLKIVGSRKMGRKKQRNFHCLQT